LGLIDSLGDSTLVPVEYYIPDCGNLKLTSSESAWSEIAIYPIPANGNLTVYSPKELIKEIVISDILGNEINRYINVNNMQKDIDTNLFPSGFYTLFVKTENQNYSRKISIVT